MSDAPAAPPPPAVRLEPLEVSHADALFEGLRDPALYEFVAEAPPASLQALRARYAHLATRRSPDGAEGWLNWAVWAEAAGAFVGYVQATVDRQGGADVAYVLLRPHQGRGYARAAVTAMLERLRAEPAVTTVRARVDARHRRSRALLGALGFRCVGVLKATLRGRPTDDVLYARDLVPLTP